MPQTAPCPIPQTHDNAPASPFVIFEDGRDGGQALLFDQPEEIIVAHTCAEVSEAFERMEAAQRRGSYLAGYASYELGYCLEPKFSSQTAPLSHMPLLNFGAFKKPRPWSFKPTLNAAAPQIILTPAWTQTEYAHRFQQDRKSDV